MLSTAILKGQQACIVFHIFFLKWITEQHNSQRQRAKWTEPHNGNKPTPQEKKKQKKKKLAQIATQKPPKWSWNTHIRFWTLMHITTLFGQCWDYMYHKHGNILPIHCQSNFNFLDTHNIGSSPPYLEEEPTSHVN